MRLKETICTAVLVVLATGFAGCDQRGQEIVASGEGEESMAVKTEEIRVSSEAFDNRQAVPRKYTGQGKDISPPLNWESGPKGTETFAIIVDDPDAPGKTWVHWVVYNIPGDVTSLPEGASPGGQLPGEALEGRTDFGKNQYGGPMPPGGESHRYYFKVYALDSAVDLGEGATKQELLDAMDGHVLANGQLVGTYKKK